MIGHIEILNVAQRLAEHAGARQAVVARNVANADTPGYKQLDVAGFQEIYRQSEGFTQRATRPGHFTPAASGAQVEAHVVAGATMAPNGNTVSLEDEILKSAVVRQQHDMALTVYRSGLGVIRASLGRR